ncbi:unnamed protein product [Camellia sinensis]
MAVIASTDYDRMKEVKEFDDSKIGVKGLSDSGVTAIPKFFIQPPETLSTLKSSSFNTGGIPVIDLSNINSPKLRPNIVSQIREAAKTWGFFQVINHGVPNYIINKTLMSIRSFHEQPQEIKAEHYVRDEFNGFVYASNNDLLRSKVASWHDYVNAWMWPDAVEAEKIPAVCREEVVEWDRYVTDVGEKVAELLSEGLGLAAGKLKEEGLLGSRLIAGVYYPYCPQPNLTFGLNPHTDPGVLTVLVENQVMGLQVKHEGEWVDVKPLPGSLIVNIGDALQIMSNGEYRSVEHRVLANSMKEPRISIVEFFSLCKKDEIRRYGPFPELLTAKKPALYRNFLYKEFHDNFFSKGLDSKSFVEKLMIPHE